MDQRYRDLFDNAPVAFLVTDERGTVREANRAAAVLLRAPVAELVGTSLFELAAPHDRREISSKLAEAGNGDVDLFVTLRVRRNELAVKMQGRAERDPAHAGWRRWRLDGMASSDTAGTPDFVATLGHELRNPLAAIRSAVELWRHGTPLTDEQRAWTVDVVSRQTDRLAHVIDELMDVARLADGRLRLRKRVLDVRESIQQAYDVLRAQVQLHEVVLDLPPTPLLVRADETRLRQIVVHLLDNASKFTPRGGRIVIAAREEEGSVRISVRDSGIGIASDRLQQVFGQIAGEPGGDEAPGVGLVLVRRLVELHGGTIGAWSDATRGGTEVTITLPLVTEAGRPSDVLPRANLRLLVVDDNVDAAETLGILLEAQGHVVTLAFDGASALELAGRGRHDAVLLDLGLPDLDGLEIARHIKATAPAIHLIAVTGYGDEQHRAHARAAGFAQHLLKPVERDALRRALAEVRPREAASSS